MSVIVSFIAIAVVAILLQGILEIRGAVRPSLNATSYIPVAWQPLIAKPYVVPGADSNPPVELASVLPASSGDEPAPLRHLIENLKSGGGEGVVVVRDTPDSEVAIKANLHDEQEEGPHGGKEWDALSHEERTAWKQKLKDAGHWAEEFGETILKSVVFGELAGVVAQAVQG